jgi:hypothetical protein
MLVDIELRERLNTYCLVTKQTQERAANVAISEMLQRLDGDPLMKARMTRAIELKEALANL